MRLKTVLHAGLFENCFVCNPAAKRVKEKKTIIRREAGSTVLDTNVRRQIGAEIADDEPTKDEKFQMLQKYGVAAPRIDRQVSKPTWMSEATWKRKMNEFYQATKGMVAPQQQKRSFPNRPFRPTFRKNFAPTPTAIPQN